MKDNKRYFYQVYTATDSEYYMIRTDLEQDTFYEAIAAYRRTKELHSIEGLITYIEDYGSYAELIEFDSSFCL
jgi:hypothetical protein